MKKILLSLLALGVVSNNVWAQEEKFTVEHVKVVNNTLVIKLKNPPFYYSLNGMADNNEQSIIRGKTEGAALQYFLSSNALETAQVDKSALIKEVNSFTKNLAKYYKSHRDLIGGFIVEFTIFPGYIKPYQIDLNKVPQDYIPQIVGLNKIIKDNTKCNSDKMCQVTVLTSAKFTNFEDSSILLNNNDLAKFLDKQPKNNIEVYTKNKDYLQPIPYFVVYGTNGYHVELEQLKKSLNLPTND